MPMIAFASLAGAPGTTSALLALASAACGQVGVLVADCDPCGGDIAARLGSASDPGLVTLAATARQPVDGLLAAAHAHTYASGVQVLPAPAAASQAAAAVAALAPQQPHPLQVAARQPGRLVMADLGRLYTHSPAWTLASAAELLLLVARPQLDAVAHLADPAWPARAGAQVRLLLIGRGVYAAEEVAVATRTPVLGVLPMDRTGVTLLPAALLGNWAARRSHLLRAARALLPDLLTAAGATLATAPTNSRRGRRARILAMADRDTP